MIQKKYRGIRTAPGLSVLPGSHREGPLWDLLDVEANTAHPESRYFDLGKIDRDQILDHHEREGITVAEVERWLGPNLNYDLAS